MTWEVGKLYLISSSGDWDSLVYVVAPMKNGAYKVVKTNHQGKAVTDSTMGWNVSSKVTTWQEAEQELGARAVAAVRAKVPPAASLRSQATALLRRMHMQKLDQSKAAKMGYVNLPAVDMDDYPPIKGMEGPFRYRDGKILYYDPKEGKYYDRKTDMYLDIDFMPTKYRKAKMASMAEVAHECHVCQVKGKAGQRWRNADTCDDCAYLQDTIKHASTQGERDAAKKQLQQRIADGKAGRLGSSLRARSSALLRKLRFSQNQATLPAAKAAKIEASVRKFWQEAGRMVDEFSPSSAEDQAGLSSRDWLTLGNEAENVLSKAGALHQHVVQQVKRDASGPRKQGMRAGNFEAEQALPDVEAGRKQAMSLMHQIRQTNDAALDIIQKCEYMFDPHSQDKQAIRQRAEWSRASDKAKKIRDLSADIIGTLRGM